MQTFFAHMGRFGLPVGATGHAGDTGGDSTFAAVLASLSAPKSVPHQPTAAVTTGDGSATTPSGAPATDVGSALSGRDDAPLTLRAGIEITDSDGTVTSVPVTILIKPLNDQGAAQVRIIVDTGGAAGGVSTMAADSGSGMSLAGESTMNDGETIAGNIAQMILQLAGIDRNTGLSPVSERGDSTAFHPNGSVHVRFVPVDQTAATISHGDTITGPADVVDEGAGNNGQVARASQATGIQVFPDADSATAAFFSNGQSHADMKTVVNVESTGTAVPSQASPQPGTSTTQPLPQTTGDVETNTAKTGVGNTQEIPRTRHNSTAGESTVSGAGEAVQRQGGMRPAAGDTVSTADVVRLLRSYAGNENTVITVMVNGTGGRHETAVVSPAREGRTIPADAGRRAGGPPPPSQGSEQAGRAGIVAGRTPVAGASAGTAPGASSAAPADGSVAGTRTADMPMTASKVTPAGENGAGDIIQAADSGPVDVRTTGAATSSAGSATPERPIPDTAAPAGNVAKNTTQYNKPADTTINKTNQETSAAVTNGADAEIRPDATMKMSSRSPSVDMTAGVTGDKHPAAAGGNTGQVSLPDTAPSVSPRGQGTAVSAAVDTGIGAVGTEAGDPLRATSTPADPHATDVSSPRSAGRGEHASPVNDGARPNSGQGTPKGAAHTQSTFNNEPRTVQAQSATVSTTVSEGSSDVVSETGTERIFHPHGRQTSGRTQSAASFTPGEGTTEAPAGLTADETVHLTEGKAAVSGTRVTGKDTDGVIQEKSIFRTQAETPTGDPVHLKNARADRLNAADRPVDKGFADTGPDPVHTAGNTTGTPHRMDGSPTTDGAAAEPRVTGTSPLQTGAAGKSSPVIPAKTGMNTAADNGNPGMSGKNFEATPVVAGDADVEMQPRSAEAKPDAGASRTGHDGPATVSAENDRGDSMHHDQSWSGHESPRERYHRYRVAQADTKVHLGHTAESAGRKTVASFASAEGTAIDVPGQQDPGIVSPGDVPEAASNEQAADFSRPLMADVPSSPADTHGIETKTSPVRPLSYSGSGELQEHAGRMVDSIVQRARILVRQGDSSAVIELDPPSLGKMKLDLVTENSKVTGRIIVESHEVREMINSNIHHLRENLAQNGLRVESFDVQVGHNGGTDSWANRENAEFAHNGSASTSRGGGNESADTDPPPGETTLFRGGRSLESGDFDRWI